MNIFGSIMRAGMTHEEKELWEGIQKLLHNGEITQEEADRRYADLEATLHQTFDGEAPEQDEA